MKKIYSLFLSLCIFGAVSGQMRYFYAVMSGANEVPPNASTASGVMVAKFNTSTKLLEVYGNYTGLTTAVTAAHIHTGAAGVGGGVLFGITFTGGMNGNLTGSSTLVEAIAEANLLAGNLYVNVHTSTYPGGEIRAQLSPIASGDGLFFNSRLQSSQEIPVNGSIASGMAHIVFEKSTRNVYLTGNFTGLTSNVNNAHIHRSRAGVNGGVALGLTYSTGTAGTLHGSGTLSVTDADSIVNNRTYVNVHSTNFPAGEIRGQVTNYSQIRFFGGRLSGANEVPPVASSAAGTVVARYNPETNEIELTGDYQNLSATISASHIHTGAAGANGGVLVGLANTGGTSGGLYVKTILTEPQEIDLLAGNLYVNVHSSNAPAGEIRTQLLPSTAGETQYAEVTLLGMYEVPPIQSTGFGGAVVMVDKVTGQTYITGIYSDLTSNVVGAHLHRSLAGTNGPIIMQLTHTGGTQGTVSGAHILTPPQVDSFINGMTYINIHTSNFTGGEIRGQAGNQVLPVRWGNISGFRNKNSVIINWDVLTEENVKEYDVEQQNTQSGIWVHRSTIPAKSLSPASYSADDIPAFFGETFVNYRIKAIDKDGSFSWSKVVRINLEEQTENLIIMGNPVTTTLRFMLGENVVNERAQAVIVDIQGRVYSQTTLATGGNQSISTSSLSSGIYILQIKTGNETISRKFVKQ